MLFYFAYFALVIILLAVSDLCFRQSEREEQEFWPSRSSCGKLININRIISFVLRISAATILSLLMGLRYGIGYDYSFSYVPSFDSVRGGGVSHYEPLFNLFLKIVATLTDDSRWFFLIEAFVFIAVIFLAIGILYDYFTFPIALFIFGYHYLRAFCFMAQYLAMALSLLAIALYVKKKYVLSAIFLVAAALTHSSSVVLLIIPLLQMIIRMRSSHRGLYLIALSPILTIILNGYIVNLLTRLYLNTRYSYYENSWFNNDYVDKTLIIVNAIFWIYGIILLILNRNVDRNIMLEVFIITQAMAFSFSLLQGAMPLVYRIIWYFMFPQVILLPQIVNLKKEIYPLVPFIKIGIVISFTVWMILSPMKNNTDMVIPYESIWM